MKVYKSVPLHPRLVEKFWRFVDTSGGAEKCWEWQHSRNTSNYGSVRINDHYRVYCALAHRLSWAIHNGPIPDGLLVCHACDNPPCCNPAHLWLGTDADNIADMRAKGRDARGARSAFKKYPELYYGDRHWARRRPELIKRGEAAVQSKLTEAQAQRIIDEAIDIPTCDALASEFCVAKQTVYDVWHRRTWKHLGGARKTRPVNQKALERERLWAKLQRGAADECWPWIGAKNAQGAGVFWLRGKDTSARRAAYVLTVRELDHDEAIESLCRTIACCNPLHMRVVKRADCARRAGRIRYGREPVAAQARLL